MVGYKMAKQKGTLNVTIIIIPEAYIDVLV